MTLFPASAHLKCWWSFMLLYNVTNIANLKIWKIFNLQTFMHTYGFSHVIIQYQQRIVIMLSIPLIWHDKQLQTRMIQTSIILSSSFSFSIASMMTTMLPNLVTTLPPDVATPVRLMGGNSPFQGRVEVYLNNAWGTICDDSWDTTDARVCILEATLHYL